ncbi:MAG: O-antigen ligase family protein [Chloroflexi bacterium]|nr:O-antigen ligase family protein [Chloroflexota bacterium]
MSLAASMGFGDTAVSPTSHSPFPVRLRALFYRVAAADPIPHRLCWSGRRHVATGLHPPAQAVAPLGRLAARRSNPPRQRRSILAGTATVFEWIFAPIGVDAADSTSGDASRSGRAGIWSRAIFALQDFPITGLGLNNFRHVVHISYPLFDIAPSTDIAHAHNHLLQAGLDLGLPGLVAYLAIWFIAAGMLWSSWLQSSSVILHALALGCGAGLLAHFIYGITDVVALGSRPGFLFWFLLGIVMGLWHYQHSSCPSLHQLNQVKNGF